MSTCTDVIDVILSGVSSASESRLMSRNDNFLISRASVSGMPPDVVEPTEISRTMFVSSSSLLTIDELLSFRRQPMPDEEDRPDLSEVSNTRSFSFASRVIFSLTKIRRDARTEMGELFFSDVCPFVTSIALPSD
jgi:hypothetical protein